MFVDAARFHAPPVSISIHQWSIKTAELVSYWDCLLNPTTRFSLLHDAKNYHNIAPPDVDKFANGVNRIMSTQTEKRG